MGYVLYHGTSSVAVECILKEGLIPKKGTGCDAWSIKVGFLRFGWPPTLVFLASSGGNAMRYAKLTASITNGEPAVLRVKVPNVHIPKLSSYFPGAWHFEGTIPAEWISVWTQDD